MTDPTVTATATGTLQTTAATAEKVVEAIAKVERHVADATSKGAKVMLGGKQHALGRTLPLTLVARRGEPALDALDAFLSAEHEERHAARLGKGVVTYMDVADIGRVVVGVHEARPVYLRDVATVTEAGHLVIDVATGE